jgi:hypothetical protein
MTDKDALAKAAPNEPRVIGGIEAEDADEGDLPDDAEHVPQTAWRNARHASAWRRTLFGTLVWVALLALVAAFWTGIVLLITTLT